MSRAEARQRTPAILVQASVRNPRAALLLWALLLLSCLVGAIRLDVDTSTDSVLDVGGEPWRFYKESEALFGGDEVIVVALGAERPLGPPLLREVPRLTKLLEKISGVRRVDSISSVPVIRGTTGGALDLSPALRPGMSSADVRGSLARDRVAPNNLVSDDLTTAAINVLLQPGPVNYDTIVEEVEAVVAGTRAAVSGVPVFRAAASARTKEEIGAFVPLTLLAMGALVWIVYGSIRMAVVALSVGAAGTLVMASAMGLVGTSMSLISMTLPTMMLALGCAYSMHMLSASRPQTPESSLEARLVQVAFPVALSSLTTAVGFAAIGTVRIEEVRVVGGYGALGSLVLGVATLTLAPAMLSVWGPAPERRDSRDSERRAAAWLTRVATSRGAWVKGGWTVALIALAIGVSRIDVETDATKWFQKGNSVRDAYDHIGKVLSGISPVNVVVQAEGPASVLDASSLVAIDALTDVLSELPQVGKALSVRDPLRQLHGGFSGDDSMPLPLEPGLAEQYLLILESVEEVADLISGDRRAANIPLRVDDNGSDAIMEIEERVSSWWAAHGPEGLRARTTGIMYEFARAEDEIAFGQLRGLVLALCAVGLTMLLSLRSPLLALVSLVPNIVPVLMVFGAMGWLGVPLDAGTVVVGSLAFGIAVDDTIHLVSEFHENREAGVAPTVALERALVRVLHPLLLTTVAIVVGFGLIGLSEFTLTRNLGCLLASVAFACVLADLSLLPALLARRGVTPT